MRKSRTLAAALMTVIALPVGASAHGPETARRSSSLIPLPEGAVTKKLELLTTVPTGAAISGEFAHTGNFFYVSSLNSIRVLDTSVPEAPVMKGMLPMAEFENEAMS